MTPTIENSPWFNIIPNPIQPKAIPENPSMMAIMTVVPLTRSEHGE